MSKLHQIMTQDWPINNIRWCFSNDKMVVVVVVVVMVVVVEVVVVMVVVVMVVMVVVVMVVCGQRPTLSIDPGLICLSCSSDRKQCSLCSLC